MGEPGAVDWIYLRVPPYLGVADVGAGAGLAVVAAGDVVGAGLAVVAAGDVVAVGDAAGFGAGVVVGAGVVAGVPQPNNTAAQSNSVITATISFFIFKSSLFFTRFYVF